MAKPLADSDIKQQMAAAIGLAFFINFIQFCAGRHIAWTLPVWSRQSGVDQLLETLFGSPDFEQGKIAHVGEF
ncbi:MAG: hypothetical protein ABJQ85_12110 [Rhizobiaceae bacterium]